MSLNRLRLFQLVSPALPVGAFSYSEGLEVLVQTGQLRDATSVRRWLEAELDRGALTIEAASLGRLMDALARWREAPDGPAWQELLELDGWLLAQREAAEVRAQQRQMGRSLLQLLAELGLPLPQGRTPRLAWPAAWAWAGLALEIAPRTWWRPTSTAGLPPSSAPPCGWCPWAPPSPSACSWPWRPPSPRGLRTWWTPTPRPSGTGVGAGLAQLGHGELYSRLFRS